MIIKKLTNATELDELIVIDKVSFISTWNKNIYSKMLNSDIYELFGGYKDGKLAGFICVSDTTDVIEIIRVAVSPKYRKQGLGEKLINFVEKKSKREELFLEVRTSNEAAIALYFKLGFEKIGIRKKYYSDTNEDAIIMKKLVKIN